MFGLFKKREQSAVMGVKEPENIEKARKETEELKNQQPEVMGEMTEEDKKKMMEEMEKKDKMAA